VREDSNESEDVLARWVEVSVNLDECVIMKSHENKAVPYGERCSLGCKLDLILLINWTIGIDLQLTKHIRIRNKNQQKKSITYLSSVPNFDP
jgi:hypothetical protein